MTITTIRYARKVQIRQYEPVEVELIATVDDGENPVTVYDTLCKTVAAMLDVEPAPTDLQGSRAALADHAKTPDDAPPW